MSFNTICLIPAAGFGTRVGSPEAKEMMASPLNQKPLIDWGLDLTYESGLACHVATRTEKPSLIQHLQERRQNIKQKISVQLVEPTTEWPDTILKMEPYWQNYNLVLLPDVVFAPTSALIQMQELLTQSPLVFAGFEVQDLSTWGVYAKSRGASGQPITLICEKPKTLLNDSFYAWGLFGFHRKYGKKVLQAMLASSKTNQIQSLDMPCLDMTLDEFKDLTRPQRARQ